MCVTDRHDMTSTVKVALDLNTTNHRILPFNSLPGNKILGNQKQGIYRRTPRPKFNVVKKDEYDFERVRNSTTIREFLVSFFSNDFFRRIHSIENCTEVFYTFAHVLYQRHSPKLCYCLLCAMLQLLYQKYFIGTSDSITLPVYQYQRIKLSFS